MIFTHKPTLAAQSLRLGVVFCVLLGLSDTAVSALTELADLPQRATQSAPPNVLFTPSVEFPTAVSRAHIDNTFNSSKRYDGYFDPEKCYEYRTGDISSINYSGESLGYFYPIGATSSATNYTCTNAWSGNFMNWATMQTADLFRWALTGGARDVDSPAEFTAGQSARTVLIRAYNSSQAATGASGNFPDRTLDTALASAYTPLTQLYPGVATFVVANARQGIKMRVTPTGGTAVNYDVRVEVCVAGMLEANCLGYKDPDSETVVYRPVGLIQNNLDKMRFGAFGYLVNNSGTVVGNSEGGVLRAKMADVSDELTETGAYVANPAPVDAAATNALIGGGSTAVQSSGVMNYINLFGFKSQLYKRYDPVSELYAEAIRYLEGRGVPTDGYVAGQVSSSTADGFPVISDWGDPLLYSCQQNFIIGIGDVNTHADRNLSGNTAADDKEPSVPDNFDKAEQLAGQTANEWTSNVGKLEGIANLQTTLIGSNKAGYFIAGLAYYAHTQDIRPGSTGVNTGKQTVDTYWIDVLEYSSYRSKNQFWLAAKYGGFKDLNENATFDSATDSWFSVNSQGVARTLSNETLPDNYFPAADAAGVVSGLTSAFSSINEAIGAGAGVGLASSSLSTVVGASSLYQVTYDSSGWVGDVKGLEVTGVNEESGVVTTEVRWSAAAKLDAQVSDFGRGDSRIIVAGRWDTPGVEGEEGEAEQGTPVFSAVPFRWEGTNETDRISSTQKAQLGNQAITLEYLRGSRENESTDTVVKAFRKRKNLLGDIVNAEAVYVGPPGVQTYSDGFNPGYSDFVAAQSERTEMIYAAANDGMLHAINATTAVGGSGGREQWAYMPSFVFSGPSGNYRKDGIYAFTQPSYTHYYYVDATPSVRDIDLSRAGNEDWTDVEQSQSNWRTLLVGGLGKGGRGYYAIDVTDPVFASENALKEKVLWEFTDEDMGYSYGRPVIVKTRRWGWVVLLASGYNNVTGTDSTNHGKGFLFVVSPVDGSLLAKVSTGTGSATNPSGLAHLAGFVQNYSDYTVEQVYGGDLLGNVWRFDLSSAEEDIPAPVKIAELSVDGVPQPVTTPPQVEYDAYSARLSRYVFIGTGRYLHLNDASSSQQQSFYAIRDGYKSTPFRSGTGGNLPSGVEFPVNRGEDLVEVTDLTMGAAPSADKPMGWYYDFTGGQIDGGAAERLVTGPLANDGAISWVTTIPTPDPCEPTGTSVAYSTSYSTGRSVFVRTDEDGKTERIAKIEVGRGLVKLQPVRVGSTIRLLATDSRGDPSLVGSPVGGVDAPRVVNWRYIGQ